jgi:hypothetical protein
MALRQEIWHQDPAEKDLWVGENGLLVNTAALRERASYFEIVEVPVQPALVSDRERLGGHAF